MQDRERDGQKQLLFTRFIVGGVLNPTIIGGVQHPVHIARRSVADSIIDLLTSLVFLSTGHFEKQGRIGFGVKVFLAILYNLYGAVDSSST